MESTLIDANITFKKIDSRYVSCYRWHERRQEAPAEPTYWLACIPQPDPDEEQAKTFSLSFLKDMSGAIEQDVYYLVNTRRNRTELVPVPYYDHDEVLPLLESFRQKCPATLFLFQESLKKDGQQTVQLLLPDNQEAPLGITFSNPDFGSWIQDTIRNHYAFKVLDLPAYPEGHFKFLYPSDKKLQDSFSRPEHYEVFSTHQKSA